ncbi:MAG: hypothetical protein EOM23_03460 [Candidatus Moranbacteria bacterium]|nr:hypothetical protein [Candidatus Moranbacteria bacterium]
MNSLGLFYVTADGKKYFYRSFPDLDSLTNHIRIDEDFQKIEKVKLEIIILKEEEKPHENNH